MKTLALEKFHADAGAQFCSWHGWQLPAHYGEASAELVALRNTVIVADFSFLTQIRATGNDRADYLNRRLCQKVINLPVSHGRRAALLDGIGKLQTDMDIFARESEWLILSLPYKGNQLAIELEKFVFVEDCQFELLADTWTPIAVIGPQSHLVLNECQLPIPSECVRLQTVQHAEWGEVLTLRSEYALNGTLVFVPPDQSSSAIQALQKAATAMGGRLAGLDAIQTARIEKRLPWWGEDFDTESVPLDANLLQVIHFDKGCYPGQETIARIHNLGHPSHQLVAIRFDTPTTFKKGTELETPEGSLAGHVTSSAPLPMETEVHALAMVKWHHREPGTELIANGPNGPVRGRILDGE